MQLRHFIIFIALIFTAMACTEIPQGAIIDQSDYFDNDDNPIIDDQTVIKRPTNQIFIKDNFCACKLGEPVNISATCETKCSAQASNDQRTLLFLEVTVGEQIQNSQFQNLKGWCTQNLLDPATQENLEPGINQSCEIIFTDKDNPAQNVAISVNPNNISGNTINNLDLSIGSILSVGKRYGFTISETATNVSSNTKDIRIYNELVDTLLDVPLFIEGIYQYACITSTITIDNNNINYLNAEKVHFYYSSNNRPDPIISTTNANIKCHTQNYPTNTTPLIDQTPGQIKLWDQFDIRFGDYIDPVAGTSTGDLYIDRIMKQLVEEYSGLSTTTTPKLFTKLEYFSDPISATASNGGGAKTLGYMMTPFKDTSTQIWYCPDQNDYYGTDPVMKALREIVREDTQGIYYAKQQNKENDGIFILEEDVKKAWFYLDNGVEIEPTESNIRGKKVQFYWPISEDSPRQKKPHQVVYTIQKAKASDTVNVANLPQDNRIGCAPKI